jgi:hypothetical protein
MNYMDECLIFIEIKVLNSMDECHNFNEIKYFMKITLDSQVSNWILIYRLIAHRIVKSSNMCHSSIITHNLNVEGRYRDT